MLRSTMNKKSQGISINVIIIAAVSLIVLVVLVAIFTGRFGAFSKGIGETGTCNNLGGACADSCSNINKERIYGATDCGRDLTNQGGTDLSKYTVCCKR